MIAAHLGRDVIGMKVVIQCCATKDARAGSFAVEGRPVTFAAHPELHPQAGVEPVFRPDDLNPGSGMTWREHVVAYNESGGSPNGLLSAGSLYSPPAYRSLLQAVGRENLFILSAGWGLVRADYMLPKYDITFSSQADGWKRRRKHDQFRDFAHLTQDRVDPGETIYFFGGIDYLPLYYQLTRQVRARKVIYFASDRISRADGHEYIKYGGTGTNWHYRCVTDFLAGTIAK